MIITPRQKIEAIIRIVSIESRIPIDRILGQERYRAASHSRQVAQVLAYRKMPNRSMATIGRVFHRDPTSVLNSFRVVDHDLATDGPRAALYRAAENKIDKLLADIEASSSGAAEEAACTT